MFLQKGKSSKSGLGSSAYDSDEDDGGEHQRKKKRARVENGGGKEEEEGDEGEGSRKHKRREKKEATLESDPYSFIRKYFKVCYTSSVWLNLCSSTGSLFFPSSTLAGFAARMGRRTARATRAC